MTKNVDNVFFFYNLIVHITNHSNSIIKDLITIFCF